MRSFCRLFALLSLATAAHAADPGDVLQLVDYVAVDYPEAVQDGAIVHTGEYAEMREFTARAREMIGGLPDHPRRAALLDAATTLERLVAERAPLMQVRDTAARLREGLLAAYPLSTTPVRSPDLERGRELYLAHCAGCHGRDADGRGSGAAGLEPPPTDFTDAERARQRSLFGLYSTISRGVTDTAMPSFSRLTDQDRWALAHYVGSRYAAGAAAAPQDDVALPTLEAFTTRTPAELETAGHAPELIARLRHEPAALFGRAETPLATARRLLHASGEAYAAGDAARAAEFALAAYLDGFELAEAALATTDGALMRQIEDGMLGLRNAIDAHAPAADVAARVAALEARLAEAERQLGDVELSAGVAFSSAFVILLREGLEAILVVGALAAFVSRTGHRAALAWLHAGWLLALAAGVATWGAATWLLEIGGATRELTEGLTALLAAAILFWVGFWMHEHLDPRQWQRFIERHVQTALDRRAQWGIAFIAFVATYREVFETILFYQALWLEADAGGARGALLGGALLGAVGLLAVLWAMHRWGMRLPLRKFFAASAGVMIALSVVLAGKGVAALQEAGRLPIDPVAFPRIELLGIYPNLQSLAAQLLLLAAALGFVLYNRRAAARLE